jgi:RNA polymerase sigma-70 factor (ECF subfamily)
MTIEADELVQVLLRERLRVTAIASAIVRDVHAADDIFQQVVLAALEDRDRFREPGHVLSWALRAARHRAIDLARRRRVLSLPDEVLDLLETEWSDPSGPGWSDQMEALHRCVSRLTEPARRLLQLRYAEGLSASIMAGKLRRTPDAIYQSLSRIHRALRDCVGRELARRANPAEGGVS